MLCKPSAKIKRVLAGGGPLFGDTDFTDSFGEIPNPKIEILNKFQIEKPIPANPCPGLMFEPPRA
ncbi:uncharacterized protein METZ01_LOCUS467942 [marine metagenome]|jgi:hypothetical protein|uniref:Uncharacterized protein n=1 Tax=marine metagenome TaxID=408172 RepID=A0A383B6T4_9ZZZZ